MQINRKYGLVLYLFTLLSLFVMYNGAYSQELKIKYRNQLFCQVDDSLFQIKILSSDSNFQGYAVIDSINVFIAYQDETNAEASTIISIVNIRTGKESKLTVLYATGDSQFEYNQENGLVVFNLLDGIYILKAIWIWNACKINR